MGVDEVNHSIYSENIKEVKFKLNLTQLVK